MPRPLAHQNFAILQNQSRNHAFHRRSYSRGKEKSFQAQAVDFSSCLPTNAAQYSTSSRSSPAKAAGKWLSISSSPTTLPRTKIGTQFSVFVREDQAECGGRGSTSRPPPALPSAAPPRRIPIFSGFAVSTSSPPG